MLRKLPPTRAARLARSFFRVTALSAGLCCAAAVAQSQGITAGNRQAPAAAAAVSPTATGGTASAAASSDRALDGLTGPVRRVRTETAKLIQSGIGQSESPRVLLEVAAYDIKGSKIDNSYFPVEGGSLTGKEVYKYDEKGNITEMTLQAADGSVLSKETYSYAFDSVGNWTKMTTAVAVVEGGKVIYEPSEVTYRTITYFLEGSTAKLVQPVAATTPAGGRTDVGKAPINAAKLPKLPANQPGAAAAAAIGVMRGGVVFGDEGEEIDAASIVKIDAEPPARQNSLRPISGGVLNGTALSLPKPAYPEAARRVRASGAVTVDVVVDEKGKVISAKAVSGQPLLHQAAVSAARQARFTPAMLSDRPVRVSGTITYNFALQ